MRQARDVRQMTAAALSERINVTGATVSMWEKGKAQPRPDALRELSAVLELPEPFFFRPPCATAPQAFRFRSLSAATKRARRAAEGRAQWLHEIVELLRSELELPAVSVPELDVPADPALLTADEIERAAEATRAMWGLRDGPIPHVNKLLESNGIIIARLALNAAELDGLSGWSDNSRPYLVLNSEKASCVRSRFDAAHELGHLVLHRKAPLRPESSVYKLMELQAHRFAGAFIFPRTAVVDEAVRSDLDSLVRLKERWRLSIAATIYRLFHLGLIDDHRKAWLQRQQGARGWRSWEPLDDQLQQERPTVVQQGYHLLCDSAGWSPADISRQVPLGDHDHELLAGLPSRWMKGDHRNLGELVRIRATAASTEPTIQSGKILRFPGTVHKSDD